VSTTDSSDLDQARLAVLSAVMEGDAGLALDIVGGQMANGVPFDAILFDIIAPLQSDVGRRWEQGDFGIAEEHASTGAIETLVALLSGSLSQPDDGAPIVVACAEGDHHSLPARMAAAYLLYIGYRTTFLGTSVPSTDLGPYLAETKPAALVLSCAMSTSLPGARDCIKAAHASGIPVVAGGRGFGDGTRATRLGADAWVANPRDLDELLATWHPHPDTAEAHARDRDEETNNLEHAAAQLVTDATTRAADILGDTVHRAKITADLRILVDAAVAGVLTGDPTIVGEFAHWHSGLRAQTHAGYETTPILLAALHDAIGDISPTAASHLDLAIAALD
jgi:methanogenic corrinoid protein MtbC1